MLSTFQALLVAALAILPGALYTWAFEREAGAWGVGLSDRLLRFFGASAIFSVLTLPLIYQGYRSYIVSGDLRRGVPLPWWIWALPPVLLLVPAAAGWLVGWATRHGRSWVRPLVGPGPAPRGWDQLFRTPGLTGYVRVKLTDGTWLVGVWATSTHTNQLPGSYAAGFPHDQDLYFVDTCEVDEDGQMVLQSEVPVRTGAATLVRWDQVAYADFIQA